MDTDLWAVGIRLNGPGLGKHSAEGLAIKKMGRGVQIGFLPWHKIQRNVCFKEILDWQRRLTVARQTRWDVPR